MDTLEPKCLFEMLVVAYNSLKCAANLNVALGFVLENLEDGSCRFYYAHEKITLLEKSKVVATRENLREIKQLLVHTDVKEWCTRERANIEGKFYKLTNVTNFTAILKEVPMGCIDTALPGPLLKNHSMKCLSFEENTRKPYDDSIFLLRALGLDLHGIEGLEEETSKLLNLFFKKNCWN